MEQQEMKQDDAEMKQHRQATMTHHEDNKDGGACEQIHDDLKGTQLAKQQADGHAGRQPCQSDAKRHMTRLRQPHHGKQQ